MARAASLAIALLLACGLIAPTTLIAQDNPWNFIRKMMQPPSGKTVRKLKPPKLLRPAPPIDEVITEGMVVPPLPRLKPAIAAAAALAESEALPEVAPDLVVGPDGRLTNRFIKENPFEEPAEPAEGVVEASAAGEPETKPELPVMGYAADEDEIPLPRLRPPHDGPALASLPPEPLPPLIEPPPAAMMTCGPVLAMLGVEASPLAPINEGACGVPAPVAVASLEGGGVDLSMKAIINCDMAERFAEWLRDEVQPAAKTILHGNVSGLRIAAAYDCRNRNNAKEGKLSEHARGNAIDIAAFRVNGRWIVVGAENGPAESRFLSEVRGSACGPFTTVLGPGSDSYHSDHFHLDLASRNKRGRARGLFCH